MATMRRLLFLVRHIERTKGVLNMLHSPADVPLSQFLSLPLPLQLPSVLIAVAERGRSRLWPDCTLGPLMVIAVRSTTMSANATFRFFIIIILFGLFFATCQCVAIIHLNHREASECHAELQSQGKSRGSNGSIASRG